MARLGKVALLGVLAVAAAITLASCYLPTRFQADIVINQAGDWTLRYEGRLASGALVPGLMPDQPTPAQLAQRVVNVTADLERDPGFRSVEYLGNGVFNVLYERAGNIFRQPGITFIRTDSRILSISYIKTQNEITIRGASIPTAQRNWVTQAGLSMEGDLRVTTDAEVLDHNAGSTRPAPNGATTYVWQIRGVDAPAPRLVIKA